MVINSNCIMWRSFISIDYFKVADRALSSYNPKCVSNIRQATMVISDFLNTDNGTKYIESKFKYGY